jgi:hypothetical protein
VGKFLQVGNTWVVLEPELVGIAHFVGIVRVEGMERFD